MQRSFSRSHVRYSHWRVYLRQDFRMTGLPESGRSHLVKTAKIDICFRLV